MTQANKQIESPRRAARCSGPIDDALDIQLFKGLGDPTRVRLFSCLARCRRACSVTELSECCRVDFSVVSRHLALMERTGLLRSTKRGRVVSYEVRYHELATAFAELSCQISACAPDGPTKSGGCCG